MTVQQGLQKRTEFPNLANSNTNPMLTHCDVYMLGAFAKKQGVIIKRKRIPNSLKIPKRICIACLKSVIHKNDSRYKDKVCRVCD